MEKASLAWKGVKLTWLFILWFSTFFLWLVDVIDFFTQTDIANEPHFWLHLIEPLIRFSQAHEQHFSKSRKVSHIELHKFTMSAQSMPSMQNMQKSYSSLILSRFLLSILTSSQGWNTSLFVSSVPNSYSTTWYHSSGKTRLRSVFESQ